MTRTLIRHILAAAVLTAPVLTGCHHIDSKRLPSVPVSIVFNSAAEWNTYGVAGALDYRYFIKTEKEREPANFPYSVSTYTGFGGVLLVCDLYGNPRAYDLSCPVECKRDVRIQVDTDGHIARCPVCKSTYAVFENFGHPLSGPAAEHGYGLECYNVIPGTAQYFTITR